MAYLNLLPTKQYLEKTPHGAIVEREELFPIVRFVLELASNNVLNNLTAAVAPTANDDSSLGYSVGSAWFDTITQTLYFAQDVTPGAAVWIAVAGGGGGTVTSIATTGPLAGGTITTSGTLSITQSDSTTDGYLSSVDWNTFNNKVTSITAGSGIAVAGTAQVPIVSVDQAFNFNWTGLHTYSQIPLSPGTTPTLPNQFVDKAYVDALAGGILPAGTVQAATTAALAANTYANGAAGVGATLTANANGALPAIDGVTLSVSDAILVKDEATTSHNGQYVVTDLGSIGTPWILTRRGSYDTASEILQGTATPVLAGTSNGGKVFWMIAPDPATIGTDPIIFDILFTGAAYTASLGVKLTGFNFTLDFVANDGLKLSGNSATVAYDGTTIGIVANQLAFIGSSSDVINASTVPGATVTDALNSIVGQTYNDVLNNGNTTNTDAIHTSGGANTTTIGSGTVTTNLIKPNIANDLVLQNNGGTSALTIFDSDTIRIAPSLSGVFQIIDQSFSLLMMGVSMSDGTFYLGDLGGFYGAPFIQCSVSGGQYLLVSQTSGQNFALNDVTGITELFSPAFNLHLTGAGFSINNGFGGYFMPSTDGTPGQVLTTNGAGTASWQPAGGSGGITITTITAAALKTLVNTAAADPTVIYQVTDAGSATTGVVSVLNIMAESAGALQSHGLGTFINARMGAAVEAKLGYDVQNNFIVSVEEPLRNNKVYGGIRTSTLLQEQSVIAVFEFDNTNWRDNVFNGCQWDNTNAASEFRGCTMNCTWIDFQSHNIVMINQYMDGVSNQLSGVADIIITGNAPDLECNDFYGNDSEGTLQGLGAGAEVSYVRIGWFSNLDMGNVTNADFRFNNIGSTAHVIVATASSIRYSEFGNGVNVTLNGATNGCNFLVGDQGGVLGVTGFAGTNSTLIACSYGSSTTGLTTTNSILQSCTVSNSGASGNTISKCNLTGCTVNFHSFTGCTLRNVDAVNQTFNFTGNNQTIGDLMQNNQVILNNSTIAGAQIQLGAGGVDPTSPATGNIWYDSVTTSYSLREASNTIRFKSQNGWTADSVSSAVKGGLTDSSTGNDILKNLQAYDNYFRGINLLTT